MIQPRAPDSLRTAADWRELRPAWPSWLISAVVHACLLLLAFWLGAATRGGMVEEPARRVGIWVAPRESAASSGAGSQSERLTAESAPPANSWSDQVAADHLLDVTELLPAPRAVIGATSAGTRTAANGLEEGSARLGSFGADGVRTSVFGLQAQGNTFAYVFDRSGSMGGTGKTLLEAAKAELLASLADLHDLQQFQIIFYNEEPTLMRLANQPGQLVLATDENKKLAKAFLARITAGGGTSHENALAAAVKLRPNVIFFLTDADQPGMNAEQLARIRRLNDGRATIHAIEFGQGPKVGGDHNFIVQLAQQNGGEYRYVDVTQLLQP